MEEKREQAFLEAIIEKGEEAIEKNLDKMEVRVMYRNNWFGGDGWTFFPVTVKIQKNCPVCGGPRGEPRPHRFHECGRWFVVDVWENPCGHIDKYRDVLIESGFFEMKRQ